jgi:large subunit ribosomal protein L19
MDFIKQLEQDIISEKQHPEFKAGDTVTVNYIIKEGNKTRVQAFKGIVLQRRAPAARRPSRCARFPGA